MIYKISNNENKLYLTFKSNLASKVITKSKTAMLQGTSATQVSYLKNLIKDFNIFIYRYYCLIFVFLISNQIL